MNNISDNYTLHNGVQIPCVGYGTYKAAEDHQSKTIQMAIEAGYRYFDTASFYQTEDCLAQAIQDSHIAREDIFISSKIWKTEMGYEETKTAFANTLARLRTDYLDLYLIHWPLPFPGYEQWKSLHYNTWKAMEELYEEGKIRAIGLSNFLPHHIENLLQHSKILPMVNQVEFHPGYIQETTVQYCQERNIQVQAWSPLGRTRVLQDPLIQELANKYQVSPAQICLRFALQKQILPLPKSSSMERMKQNQNLFFFHISKEDMYRIETMPPLGWSREHPDRGTCI